MHPEIERGGSLGWTGGAEGHMGGRCMSDIPFNWALGSEMHAEHWKRVSQ